MRSSYPILFLVLTVTTLTGTASRASAQEPTDSISHNPPAYLVDVWLTQPIAIRLTVDQQKKFELIRTRYIAESGAIREQTKGDEMGAIFKMQALAARYQSLMRPILTPEQRVAFDKNVRAGVMGR